MARKKRAQREARPAADRAVPFSVRLPAPVAIARSGLWLATLLVLLVAPFLRGLYFPAEHLTAIIVLASLFGLGWLLRAVQGEPPWPWQLLDWAVLGLFLAYLLSTAVAVNLRAAAGETLKFAAYFSVYWLVAAQAREGRHTVLVDVLVAGGVGLSLVGLAALTGVARVPGAVIANRLASGLQYPNTLAAYLSVLLFLALLRREELYPSARRHLYGPAASLLVTGMLLALSRGATLVLPVAVAIFLAALPPGRRLRPAVLLGLAIAAGALVAVRVGNLARQGPAGAAWAWVLGGALAVAAGGWLLEFPLAIAGRTRRGLAALAILLLLFAGFGGVARVTPVLGRLADVTRTDANLLQRLVYNQDGLRIALSRPLLGAGGGGWEALYHSFQAYPYYSASVHNFVLEHWIATGAVGLAVLVLAWAAFAGLAWRTIRGRTELRLPVGAVATAAVTLGLHSLIDFNLVLPAVGLLLFALFGAVRALAGDGLPSRRRRAYPGGATAAAVIGALLVVLVAALLLQGHRHGQRGIALLKDERHDLARVAFEQARKADPLMGSFAMDLATCYEVLAHWRQDPALLERAGAEMQAALHREPYNAVYHHAYGIFELGQGRLREAFHHLERSVQLFPTLASFHGNLARAYVLDSLRALEQGDGETVRAHAGRVLAIEKDVAARAALAPGRAPPVFRMRVPDPTLILATGQALLLLGEDEEALARLDAAGAGVYGAEARLWRAFALARLGREGAEELAAQALADAPGLGWQFNILVRLLGG